MLASKMYAKRAELWNTNASRARRRRDVPLGEIPYGSKARADPGSAAGRGQLADRESGIFRL